MLRNRYLIVLNLQKLEKEKRDQKRRKFKLKF